MAQEDPISCLKIELTLIDNEDRIVVVAGGGRYPEIVLNKLIIDQKTINVLALDEFSSKDKYPELPITHITLENFLQKLGQLRAAGYRLITFAGSVKRPKTNQSHVPIGLPDIYGTDDVVIRKIVETVSKAGFEVVGGQDILPDLLAQPGVFTHKYPSENDKLDTGRATEIVHALGAADIGQASVVACRLCVAVETLSGTNKMLEFVAQTIKQVNPNPDDFKGVLYKGPKPQQELRIDMPTIGPDTVRYATKAGLSGIAVQAGGVLIIDQEETITLANKNNMFIWALDPTDL